MDRVYRTMDEKAAIVAAVDAAAHGQRTKVMRTYGIGPGHIQMFRAQLAKAARRPARELAEEWRKEAERRCQLCDDPVEAGKFRILADRVRDVLVASL